MRIRIWGFLFLLMGFFWVSTQGSAFAIAPSGISISPFIEQISLSPSDTQKSFSLTLSNHTLNIQELDLSTKDFGSLNDTGGIILEGSNTYTQKYGLVSWLSLETDTVVLQPGESRSVLVTVDNRSSLQPGGHYGAVIAGVNGFNAPTGNQVQINQQLTALLLVDKTGGEHYNLKLDSLLQNGNWLHLPNNIRLIFQNPGNVEVVPRGVVKLENPAGKVLAQGVINDESAFILPESYRELYVPLTQLSTSLPLPGSYHLVVEYRYDGIANYAVNSYKVGFIDLKLYAALAVLILVAIWVYKKRLFSHHKKSPEHL